MHLYSHRMECFEQFNPKYTHLAGDFSFEAIESVWSANDDLIPIIRRVRRPRTLELYLLKFLNMSLLLQMGVQRAIDYVSFSWDHFNWTSAINTSMNLTAISPTFLLTSFSSKCVDPFTMPSMPSQIQNTPLPIICRQKQHIHLNN